MSDLTTTQKAALDQIRAASGAPVVLPVRTGGKLVDLGHAVKDDSAGHGKARAAYRAA
ncbi:hypothetical protein [Limimaricola hongkongensis]|uniref:Uncharacterized protein n=1 Tax=Limimaricola hongkongensis DSM 17492 TaxID=1122180 RepID=A0A017HCA4_9RHOB|nr:hypothetical protein [Limimaricola hongkongensis]EYD71788.1 hypothetical protein Lokhon_01858 [Limimaricola hongkongensis DSM 17492]